MGKIGGEIRVTAGRSAAGDSLLLWAVSVYSAGASITCGLGQRSGGLLAAGLHFPVRVWHPGWATPAPPRTGFPMTGIHLWGAGHFYPPDEPGTDRRPSGGSRGQASGPAAPSPATLVAFIVRPGRTGL